MCMQQKIGSFKETSSKNTFYRFMNGSKTNWLKFTTLLSKAVVETIEPSTDSERVNAFNIDDGLFERTSCKKTELCSKVFDHVSMQYTKGYRLMSPEWTDGKTFVLINSTLLASSKQENILGVKRDYNGRSLADRRRKLPQMNCPAAELRGI